LSEVKRELAAIMFTDIAGYTAMMQENEAEAIKQRNRQRFVLDDFIPGHKGNILQTFGDGTLAVFPSAMDAVNCAVKIQFELQREPVCPLRIGIHTGDITYSDKDVYGDGVNVASRIESVSTAGGVFISDKVFDEIKNQPSLPAVSIGMFEFKNVSRPVEVFTLTCNGLKVPDNIDAEGKLKSKMEVIAVLPFANMSSDPDNEYFSDGISEEILNALTKVQGLQVVARTSSFSFKGKNEDMRDIGKKLGASSLIEGSVRKAGNKVRITAQLINTADGTHYWSEVYDRSLEDIFAIQDEISLDIAHKLEKQFRSVHAPTHLVTSSTTSLEAYEIYLKCIYKLSFAPTPELQMEVIRELEKAIALDSQFAKAYALLADTYVTTGVWGLIKPVEAYSKAKEYSLKALSLNENLPEAYLAYADYIKYNEWDWDAVGNSISKALQLNPGNADAHSAYGNYLRSIGKYTDALKYAEKASALDPLSVNLLNNLANNYVFTRDFDKAEKTYLEALKINPASKPTQYEFVYMYCAKGEYQKALEYVEEIINNGGKWILGKHLMALIYKNTGKPEKAKEMLDSYLTKIKNGETEADLWNLATLHTFNGDHTNAVKCLNTAADERIGAVVLIKFSVSFLGLHNDKGFKALCARVGLK
jgi:TolB-like protein/class 3 adenylate cyclase/Tfp pilus assembly protein PilF